MAEIKRVTASVTGIVQGVGFRWFTRDAGMVNGISGWVKNEPDGSVSFEAEGESESLESFLQTILKGPGSGSVKEMKTRGIPPVGEHGDFRIKY